MKEENEQGFLSKKFDDWSSEPIPNGWSKIQSALSEEPAKPRLAPFWMFAGFFVVSIASLVWVGNYRRNEPGLAADNKLNEIENQIEIATNEFKKERQGVDINNFINSGTSKTKQIEPLIQSHSNGIRGRIAEIEESNLEIPLAKIKGTFEKQNQRNNLKTLALLKVSNPNGKEQNSEKVESVGRKNLLTDDNSAGGIQSSNSLFSGSAIVSDLVNGNSNKEVLARDQKGEILDFLSTEKNVPLVPQSTIEDQSLVDNLDVKKVNLVLPEFIVEQNIVPVFVENRQPISNSANKWTFSVGVSGGYAPKSIEINQTQAISRLSIAESNAGSPSLFGNIGLTVQNEIKPWLRSFGAVKFGMMRNAISVTETSKSPMGFEMATSDSISYSMTPVWAKSSGNIKQDLLFSTLEFGLNPILFSSHQSGPFASVVVWISLFQKVSNDIGHSIASFEDSKENVALSYRLGYQHVFTGNLRGEIFTSGMPDKLLANSKGLSIKPQLIGLGIHYLIH